MVGIDHMKPDVSLDHLGHQPFDGPPAGGNRVQNARAVGPLLQRSLDGIDLTLDAANPVQELVLIANDVCQLDESLSNLLAASNPPVIIYPGWYFVNDRIRNETVRKGRAEVPRVRVETGGAGCLRPLDD